MPSRFHQRGVSRSSRTWEAGCDGREEAQRACAPTKASSRTAKACGPDLPTLGSSRRRCLRIAPATVARKARTPRRARHKPKTIAQGAPACSAVPVVSNSCAFYLCTRGCGCGQHPVLPAPSLQGRPNDQAKLGHSCREIAVCCSQTGRDGVRFGWA